MTEDLLEGSLAQKLQKEKIMQKSGWMVLKAERIEGSEMRSSFSGLMVGFVNIYVVLST